MTTIRKNFAAGDFGFLNLDPNDVITGYGGNSGPVSATIRRIQ